MEAKNYNNYPEGTVKKLGRNQTVTYRILNIKPDEDNPGSFVMPFIVNVPSTDAIYDEKSEEWYDIAYITQVKAGGEAVLGDISFEKSNAGTLTLKGSNARDQKIYEYLELCNYNVSNPNRDTSKMSLFKKIDSTADAENKRQMRRVHIDALNKAADMTDDEARFIAASLGFSMKTKIQELRNKIEEYAEDNPQEFLAVFEQQTNRTEALVREAVDLGIVTHNHRSGKFVWTESEEEIYKYSKKPGVQAYLMFAEYLQMEDANQLLAIETAVKAKRDNP
jgi:hypothetical protein